MEHKLPSKFQLKEKVGLQVLIDLLERARDGVVTRVSFLSGKVKYDIQIPVIKSLGDDPEGFFRIANVEEIYLNKPYENGLHYNSMRDHNLREHNEIIRKHEESNKGALLFTNWHSVNDIPGLGMPGAFYSDYVLIDRNGFRDPDDFEIGYYDLSKKEWKLKNTDKKVDLVHMKWTNLPINKEK